MKSLDERVADLEIRLSVSEDLVDTLNETIYRQQRQIEKLVNLVANLSERVESGPREFKSLRDEIPPHY